MRFNELLKSLEGFEGELVTNHWETMYSFSWDSDIALTEFGKNLFRKLLNSEFTLGKDNIITLQDDTITENELDAFCAMIAGYVPISLYDKCLVKVESIQAKVMSSGFRGTELEAKADIYHEYDYEGEN